MIFRGHNGLGLPSKSNSLLCSFTVKFTVIIAVQYMCNIMFGLARRIRDTISNDTYIVFDVRTKSHMVDTIWPLIGSKSCVGKGSRMTTDDVKVSFFDT